MRVERVLARLVVGLVAGLTAGLAGAGFAGTDVFLPSVGRGPGSGGSDWYTTAWVFNPNATPAELQITFLARGDSNPQPPVVLDTLPAGTTRRYANAVYAMFRTEAFGALRFVSSERVVVSGRVFSFPSGGEEKDSAGQFFAGLPASFAIGRSQSTQLLGLYQRIPFETSQYRYNFGFVETTGAAATVTVRVMDETGAEVKARTYTLGGFGVKQYSARTEFPTVDTESMRLQVEVTSGSGRVLTFGSGLANVSNDPSTFEMSFRDGLLAENAGPSPVSHDETLVGDGTAAAPLGLADGAVTEDRLAADAVTSTRLADLAVTSGKLARGAVTPEKIAPSSVSGQILTTSGGAAIWAAPATGIQTVNAGTGLVGGGSSPSVTLAVTVPLRLSGPVVAPAADSAVITAVNTGARSAAPGSLAPLPNTWAVLGKSDNDDGIRGESARGYGVSGVGFQGVFGKGVGSNGSGLYAVSTGSGAALIAEPVGTGAAAVLLGNVSVSGTLYKGGGAFRIDHPLDPEGKYLAHSFVESPDMMNVYNGNVMTDERGLAEVELPPWFEALNRDFRYQLTVLGALEQATVARKVAGNRFTIQTSRPRLEVSWQVTGIRRDRWAEAHRIPVEEDKPPAERGLYLHPREWGQPDEKDVSSVLHPLSREGHERPAPAR